MTEQLHFHFSLSCIGEGNGNPVHVLAFRIPGMGEPGGLPSMSSQLSGDFPGGSDGKESTCNLGDLGSIPGLQRSHGGGHGKPTPVFWFGVHGVAKSQT